MMQSMTIHRTCEYTGLGRTKIYELIRQGRLQKVKVDGRTLITVASADALIEASKVSVHQ